MMLLSPPSIGGHFFYIFAGIVYLADSLNDEKNLAKYVHAEARVRVYDSGSGFWI